MNTDPSAKGALNRVIGDGELCAWQPVRGVVWVQTRNPRHARRLAKRGDARLVLRGVAGGFLKTFEFRRPLTWAGRLISRYLAAEVSANAALNRAVCPAWARQGWQVGHGHFTCGGQVTDALGDHKI